LLIEIKLSCEQFIKIKTEYKTMNKIEILMNWLSGYTDIIDQAIFFGGWEYSTKFKNS